MQALSDLWHGISRHPWKTAGLVYLAFSALFTLFQAVNFFDNSVKFEGLIYLVFLTTLSVVFAFWRVWKPSKICIPVDHTNTAIEIVFGDLFSMTGIKIISVNNFFDSEIGRPVSEKSLHGIFIQRSFGGHPQSFDAQVDVQLANEQSDDVPQKQHGKTKSYAIGTTAFTAATASKRSPTLPSRSATTWIWIYC